MLDPSHNRDEVTLSEIVSAPCVKGSAIVLGACDGMVTRLLALPAITDVTYVPGRGSTLRSNRRLRIVEDCNPLHVQRRDIGRDNADFLFCDLFTSPFERARTAVMKDRAREFRARAFAYRWQEIDVVSECLGAGLDIEHISANAFGLFAKATGILISPASAEYARHCTHVTQLATRRLI